MVYSAKWNVFHLKSYLRSFFSVFTFWKLITFHINDARGVSLKWTVFHKKLIMTTLSFLPFKNCPWSILKWTVFLKNSICYFFLQRPLTPNLEMYFKVFYSELTIQISLYKCSTLPNSCDFICPTLSSYWTGLVILVKTFLNITESTKQNGNWTKMLNWTLIILLQWQWLEYPQWKISAGTTFRFQKNNEFKCPEKS